MVNDFTITQSQTTYPVMRNANLKADPALGDSVPMLETRAPNLAKLSGKLVEGRSGPGAVPAQRSSGSAPKVCVASSRGVVIVPGTSFTMTKVESTS